MSKAVPIRNESARKNDRTFSINFIIAEHAITRRQKKLLITEKLYSYNKFAYFLVQQIKIQAQQKRKKKQKDLDQLQKSINLHIQTAKVN